MSNVTKERRLITASSQQWSELNKIMFQMGVECPAKPFDMRIFANSEKGLAFVDSTSVNKIVDADKRFEMAYHLLNSLGIILTTEDDSVVMECKTKQAGKNFIRMFTTFQKRNNAVKTEKVIKE